MSGSVPPSLPPSGAPPPSAPAPAATPAATTPGQAAAGGAASPNSTAPTPTTASAPAAPPSPPTAATAAAAEIVAQLRNQFLAAVAQSTTFATALANDGKILGQVLGKEASGQTLVKTDAGQIALKLPPAITLPQGAAVTLQLSGLPKAIQAQLVQLQLPTPAAPPAPPPNRPVVSEAPATQIAQALQTRPAPQVSATVVAAAPPQPTGSNLPTLATGATVQLRLPVETTVPPRPPQAATAAPAQAQAPATAAAPAPPLPAQTSTSGPAPPAVKTPAAMEVRILAHLPGGQTLLDTPVGRLAAAWPPGLPRPAEGAKLTVEFVALQALTKVPGNADALKSNVPLAREWPALKEAFKGLTDAAPALARRLLDDAIPRPGPKLAVQIMSYLAADRTDARSLLGEAVATALDRAGRSDILQRLDGDLKEMQRQAATPSDWRVAYVPFQDGGELRQLRIFSRREQNKDKKDKDSKRFVVEVEFSELGDVQIDGLMRKPKLELMLRTHRQIPPELRDEIELVFLDGCTLAGLAGRIYFQAGERFPVNPIEEIARQSQGVVA